MTRIVLIGATGMVGAQALELALAHPDIASVTSIGRRPLGIQHPKLTHILHDDFSDCSPLAGALQNQDAALFCLGAYTGSVSDDEFRRITVDYTIAFAKVLAENSPQAAFCFLSGSGADPSETSRMAFARFKGAAEKALLASGFARVHIFRPGYIYPVVPRKEPNFGYRLIRWLYPVLRPLLPNSSITSKELAQAMLKAALHGTGNPNPVLENRDIRAFVREEK